ncbi:SUMF1/EgtB/PvdO family nonheme iron enzyme [Pseudomaricurvus sp. HS19]|uniref:formylglycine-generating enzyme family protein n=1 Tax=Pseudomaricurvus sp. HS19 TaxID=2692626 RepID=UPI001367EDC4|nr:SUMF1/EgtB/PvdO family nonheme iron enzyme [Pseudomaricurvus sp. HS19]MYM64217.1 SUMF1/EgtB/PvdO family nonheme iron enzyme [Pseudomaricurvus sp. HS19]
MKLPSLCLATLFWLFFPLLSLATDLPDAGLEFVAVGHPGNHADPDTGHGAVGYPFRIGKYEITNSDYAGFLNAVARESDPFGLYTPLMQDHFWGGIARAQEGLHYSYKAKPGYELLPVTFVSWLDAARYVNWLHFGRPTPGHSGPGITEGAADTGAYDTSTVRVADQRNSGARFWLPNHDEWYKAAFYHPDTDRYSTYATGESTPAAGLSASAPGATYFAGHWAAPFPHLTAAGNYSNSASAFGGFDFAGNVMEWVEDTAGHNKTALGGSVFMSASSLAKNYRDAERPEEKLSTFGFRVATTATPLPPAPAKADTETKAALLNAPTTEKYPLTGINGVEYVQVGHADYLSPSVYRRGVVRYPYLIGATEVTNQQWADMLNRAGAKEAEQKCLYRDVMSDGVVGGLHREVIDGRVQFAARPGWERRPATYVNWYAGAYYANYLHYLRTPDPDDDGQLEGTDERGAYDTRAFPACGESAAAPDHLPARRNPGALVFLPSVDEWYKAAYFDRQKFSSYKYWQYPTGTDEPPNNLAPPGDRFSANYQRDEHLSEGGPTYVSEVDAYPEARSAYGTWGQAGNVWEWVEDWRSKGEGGCWRCDEWTRGLMGGSFNYIHIGLHASNLDPGAPHQIYPFYGLRMAASVDTQGWQPWWQRPGLLQQARDELTVWLAITPDSHLLYLLLGLCGLLALAGLLFLAGLAGWIIYRRRH